MSEEAEEVAGFFAALLETDHAQDKTFRKNFFEDWLKVLKEYPSVRHYARERRHSLIDLVQQADSAQIKELEHCDFRPMYEYFEIQKDKKKSLTAAEKKKSVLHNCPTVHGFSCITSPESKRNETRLKNPTSTRRLMAERRRLATSVLNLLGCSEDVVNTRRKGVSRSVSSRRVHLHRR